MWKVKYQREYRGFLEELEYSSSIFFIVWTVYIWWRVRYSLSIYPKKTIKMYYVKDLNVFNFRCYYKTSKEDKNENIL